MGLLDLFKKKGAASAPQPAQASTAAGGPQRTSSAQKPEGFEEALSDLLSNQDREALYEDCGKLKSAFRAMPFEDRIDLMSEILERTVEEPREKTNYEFVIENILEPYNYLVGERDASYMAPAKVERLNHAILDLYENSGEYGRERLEYNATTLYNIPFYAKKKLNGRLLEDEDLRAEVLSHFDSIDNGGKLFCLLDFLVSHRDDPSDAARDEVGKFLKENLHPIALVNLQEVVPEGKVKNMPDYFRRVYLPAVGREGDRELETWFKRLWKS